MKRQRNSPPGSFPPARTRASISGHSPVPLLLASVWGALAVSLTLNAWPALGGAIGDMWNSWLAAPDFSWGKFGLALARHLTGLSVPVAMVAASFGAGLPVARLFRVKDLFIRTAFGWGTVSLLVQGMGYPGLYFGLPLNILAAVLVAWGVACLWIEKPWREFAGKPWGENTPKLAVLGAVLLAAYFMGRLPVCDQDARIYHLAGPEEYLLLHRIVAEPNQFSWHMPFGAEMTFLVPYGLGGFWCAKQVNVAVLSILMGLTWRLAVLLGRGSLWAPVWLGTAGLVISQSWEGKNDLMLAMYLTAAAVCALRRRTVASAAMMGLAIGIKFTGGLMVAGLMAGMFLSGIRVSGGMRWGWIIAAGLLPFAGWLAGSWLYLGNPFHPFLSGIFPELSWSPFYQEWIGNYAEAISPPESLLRRDWFFGIWRTMGSFDIGSAGLFWVLPAAILGAGAMPARFIVSVVLVAYLIWVPSVRVARYLFPLIPFIAALASDGRAFSGMFSGWNHPRIRRLVAGYTVLLTLLYPLLFLKPGGHLFLLGQKSREDVLRERYTTWDEAREWVNTQTPAYSRILLTGDAARLWFKRRIISASYVCEPVYWKLSRESWNADEMAKKFRQRGITHCLDNFVSGQYRALNWFPGPEWSLRQMAVYHGFIRRHLDLVFATPHVDANNGGFKAWRIDSRGRRPGTGPLVLHMPSTEAVFAGVFRYFNEGRYLEALQEARRVDSLMGGTCHGAAIIGRMLSKLERYQEALGVLEPGLRAGFVGNSNLHDYISAAMHTGHPAAAAKEMARLYEVSSGEQTLEWRADALVLMGNSVLSGERLPILAGEAGQERPVVPDKPLTPGHLRKALELFEQATWMDPADPYLHVGVMQVLERMGRRNEARAAGARALSRAGGNPEIASLVGAFLGGR